MKYEPYKALSFVPQALRVFRKKSLFFVRFCSKCSLRAYYVLTVCPSLGMQR